MREERNRRKESVTYAEAALLDYINALPAAPSGDVLVAGNRSGRIAIRLAEKFPSIRVTAHVFDAHHAGAIARRIGECPENIRSAVTTAVEPHIPAKNYSAAFFMDVPRSTSAELALDQLEDVYCSLAPQAKAVLAFEGDHDAALKLLKKAAPSVHVLERQKHCSVFSFTKTAEIKRRDFSSYWEASVPGGPKMRFVSYPGCFCHRRADQGGLALAETASRIVPPDAGILDMGCGSGMVGILVADAQRRANPETCRKVLFADSHARAIEAARENAKAAELEDCSEFLLSSNGLPPEKCGRFGAFLGNPPYFSDWRIAELFIETAYKALRAGGVCLTVAKTPDGLEKIQAKYFRTVERIPRRGYTVLKSVR